jgi:hypothetical protein
MNPLVGIYKGRRVHLGDLLQMSRSKSMRRNRHALAAVAACVAASDAAAMPRRTVPRALGGWRGSTLAGYVLRGDDVTYKEKLRMDSGTFSKLVGLFRGSRLDTSLPLTTQRACEIRGTTGRRRRGRRVSVIAQVARATRSRDPPTLRYKVAACMYAFAHGGPLKTLADVCSVAQSTLRGWLTSFCLDTMRLVKPLYMPAKPFSAEERAAVQGQFASRRGVPNVTLACDGSHIPFKPPNKRVALDYRNYKGWYSILAVAFVDSYYRFFDLDVGYPGRAGDNTVLSKNWLMRALSVDPAAWLGPGGLVLGDSGASDGDSFFMNPFHAPTEPEKCWFNFCHSSTRFFVEQTFGIWKSRFRFLLHPLNTKHRLTCLMIYASAILHNFLIAHVGADYDAHMSAANWRNFFAEKEVMLCPTCVREKKDHCVHQAAYRNNATHQAAMRQRPSQVRTELCESLWDEVCHGVAYASQRALIRARMQERCEDCVNADGWLPADR